MIIHGMEIAGMEGKIRRMLTGRVRSVFSKIISKSLILSIWSYN